MTLHILNSASANTTMDVAQAPMASTNRAIGVVASNSIGGNATKPTDHEEGEARGRIGGDGDVRGREGGRGRGRAGGESGECVLELRGEGWF